MRKIKFRGFSLPTEAHTLITGQPGSGKTRAILRPLLKEYLGLDARHPDRKRGMLLIDPKGDMLAWTTELLASIGRSQDLIVVGPGSHGFNLFAQMPLSPNQSAVRLRSLANSISRDEHAPEAEFWLHQQRQVIEALIELAEETKRNPVLQIADVTRLYAELGPKLGRNNTKSLDKFNSSNSQRALTTLRNFAALPSETRECVNATVSNCLSIFSQPPLQELMNPSPELDTDLIKIVDEGACVLVSCVHRSYGETTLPLLSAVKEAFADLILSRSEIEVEVGGKNRALNQEREILYIADEAQKVLKRGHSGGEVDFLDTCREFKCRVILSTQSISSLQSVMGSLPAARLVALFGNHFFLNNIDPATCDWAHRIFRPETESVAPPLIIPDVRRTNSFKWDGPHTLSELKTGEFLLRTRDGRTFRRRAPVT